MPVSHKIKIDQRRALHNKLVYSIPFMTLAVAIFYVSSSEILSPPPHLPIKGEDYIFSLYCRRSRA